MVCQENILSAFQYGILEIKDAELAEINRNLAASRNGVLAVYVKE